jgi:hypothetical protein
MDSFCRASLAVLDCANGDQKEKPDGEEESCECEATARKEAGTQAHSFEAYDTEEIGEASGSCEKSFGNADHRQEEECSEEERPKESDERL